MNQRALKYAITECLLAVEYFLWVGSHVALPYVEQELRNEVSYERWKRYRQMRDQNASATEA